MSNQNEIRTYYVYLMIDYFLIKIFLIFMEA